LATERRYMRQPLLFFLYLVKYQIAP
jgi:hypothetical protein